MRKSETTWTQLTHFRRTEMWGDYKKMHPFLMHAADRARHVVNHYFIVTCGWELEGHSPNSFHKEGKAFDFKIKQKTQGLVADAPFSHTNIFRLLMGIWWFGGIGFYPFDKGIDFHLDIGPYRFWIRTDTGKYLYGQDALDVLAEVESSFFMNTNRVYIREKRRIITPKNNNILLKGGSTTKH